MTRVLLFDLETAPNVGYTWQKWDTNVIRFTQPWYILCVGYKWLGEKQTHVVGIDDYVCDIHDDLGVVQHIHELFTQADIVVAHNGDRFDIPKARARMIIHGMVPPAPPKSIDTLKIARREFEFTSNSLDDVARVLDVGHKSATGGFDTWVGCMEGDPKAWKRMKAYCKHDVNLLEQVYRRLLPWAVNPPAANLDTMDACPYCRVRGQMTRQGFKNYKVTRKQRFQCQACGGWSVGRAIEKLPSRYTT